MSDRSKALVLIAAIGTAAIVALQVTQPSVDRGLLTIVIGFLGTIAGQIVNHGAITKTGEKIDETKQVVEALKPTDRTQ
jgi:hypothetical protein